jgi:hypothetical protein
MASSSATWSSVHHGRDVCDSDSGAHSVEHGHTQAHTQSNTGTHTHTHRHAHRHTGTGTHTVTLLAFIMAAVSVQRAQQQQQQERRRRQGAGSEVARQAHWPPHAPLAASVCPQAHSSSAHTARVQSACAERLGRRGGNTTMYVYVCPCVCTLFGVCVCMRVLVYVCKWVCMYACVCVCV